LLPRQPAGGNRRVDAVFERVLERVAELSGFDPELLRGVGDDRRAFLLRRGELGGADRDAPAGHGDGGDGSGCELAFRVLFHDPIAPRMPKRRVRGT
jgi:hypothetical protein